MAIDPRVLAQLKRIHAPVVVGVPPINAFHDLVLLPDGEIRHYGYRYQGSTGEWIYISSCDHGLSWQEYPIPAGCPGACVQSPSSGGPAAPTPPQPSPSTKAPRAQFP